MEINKKYIKNLVIAVYKEGFQQGAAQENVGWSRKAAYDVSLSKKLLEIILEKK